MSTPYDDDANTERTGHDPSAGVQEDLCSEIESYITARPFRALAIALLAGIVVGKLIL